MRSHAGAPGLAPLGATVLLLSLTLGAQEPTNKAADITVPLQPLSQQVRRLETALRFLGQPFSATEQQAINDAVALADERAAVERLQQILDPYVLARVHINPESRVRVEAGRAKPELVEGGTRLFLVKVINEAHVTAPLAVQSANTGPVYRRSSGSPRARMEVTEAHVRDRWADISIYDKPPLRPRLSGLGIEYVILEVFSRDAGQRSATISFNVGQGTQDIGFRNDIGGAVHVDAGASRPARRERRARPAHDRRIL